MNSSKAKKHIIFSVWCFLLFPVFNISAQELNGVEQDTLTRSKPQGWWFPQTGFLSGNFESGVSTHFWSNYFRFRNLQFRTQVNLWNGLRVNNVLRSNRELIGIEKVDPMFDELYLEYYGYHFSEQGMLSFSARGGRMRYVRFPFPDKLSIFDIVPRVSDLNPGDSQRTSYDGLMLTLDYKFHFGLGYHATFYQEVDERAFDRGLLENYIYYENQYKVMEWEARVGQLQLRTVPQGYSEWGGNFYFGLQWKGIRAGGMLEQLRNQDLYAGVLVQFSPSILTNLLGTFHSDYTRAPRGIGVYLPLVRGHFGYTNQDDLPEDAQQVGEIVAERRSTFWQNSQTRNFYEHQYSVEGNVIDDDLIVVTEEYAWYLKNESPVGRLLELNDFSDILTWDKSSARLGEVAQPVVYKFYRTNGVQPKRRFVIRPGVDPKILFKKYRFNPDNPNARVIAND
jgi:hypothetical protein